MEVFPPIEFDWDENNIRKNWIKHKVKPSECEDIFFNNPVIFDIDKSKILYGENRYTAYGEDDSGSSLLVVFTIRTRKVRIISARNMSRKERRLYHEERKKKGNQV